MALNTQAAGSFEAQHLIAVSETTFKALMMLAKATDSTPSEILHTMISNQNTFSPIKLLQFLRANAKAVMDAQGSKTKER